MLILSIASYACINFVNTLGGIQGIHGSSQVFSTGDRRALKVQRKSLGLERKVWWEYRNVMLGNDDENPLDSFQPGSLAQ